ncbi:MAG: ScpA family protein [bacterium]|nr:ScpA family protein [bacterium]
MDYQLKTEYFAGPIEKLLELIEAKKLDVTVMSLSEVTADFVAYTGTLRDITPATLADFIVVASRLLFIKSKALLPDLALTGEEEAEIHDLELRLLLYKECKSAAKKIGELWALGRVAYGREFLSGGHLDVFYPSPHLTALRLERSLKALLQTLAMFQLREKSMVQSALISVEQKMKDLMKQLISEQPSHFSGLAKNKDDMIALFLAILHLLKDGMIQIEQQDAFSDIMITSRKTS